MLLVERKEMIKRDNKLNGKSQRTLSREYGVSRHTISNAIENPYAPRYSPRRHQPFPKLGKFKGVICQWLEEDRSRHRKQRHTAKRVYERLVEEYDFDGGESTVRRYVSRKKKEMGLGGKEVFIPVDHQPGGECQVDWCEALIKIQGVIRKIHLFLMWLSYSGKVFAKAYPVEKQECFFDGIREGFEYFGGVPTQVRLDNLKSAVKRILKGKNRDEQADFIAFRSHYLFESSFCSPGRGNEKGGVEGSVPYVRHNWFVPYPSVESFDELNAYLFEKCERENSRKPSRKSLSIGSLFEQEKPKLLSLPETAYPCCKTESGSVDSYSRVTYLTNLYSVPVRYGYSSVLIHAYPFEIVIAKNNRVIARHERLFGRHEENLDPRHYVKLLERKPAGLDVGKPFRSWKLPPVYEQYRQAVRARKDLGTRDYMKVLSFLETRSMDAVSRAMEKSLSSNAPGYENIRLLLHGDDRKISEIRSMDMRQWPGLNGYKADITHANQYNKLIRKVN